MTVVLLDKISLLDNGVPFMVSDQTTVFLLQRV